MDCINLAIPTLHGVGYTGYLPMLLFYAVFQCLSLLSLSTFMSIGNTYKHHSLGDTSPNAKYIVSYVLQLYKCLKGKARIPTVDLIPKNRRCRNQHSMAFQIPSASKTPIRKASFPQTIRDWNVLPDTLISSAELSDDCVSKFTSLVRARD